MIQIDIILKVWNNDDDRCVGSPIRLPGTPENIPNVQEDHKPLSIIPCIRDGSISLVFVRDNL